MDGVAQGHPLTALLARRGWNAAGYLARVAERHAALGYGHMAGRKEKVTRWTRGGVEPEVTAQLAMAAVHGIPAEAVYERGWPHWLLLGFDDDVGLRLPWSAPGTVRALTDLIEGPMWMDQDRRRFLVFTATTLGTVTAQWAAAPAGFAARATGRRINRAVPDLFDARLDALRRLDDQVGSGQVYQAAITELRLITHTLTHASYSDEVGAQLYTCAAEASRICGWTAYDSGRHAIAERHYLAAMRACATAGATSVAVNTLAFWGLQHYNTGDPRGAVHLLEAAQDAASGLGSPRVDAILLARTSRAHAHARDQRASDRAAKAAFDAYSRTSPGDEDPAWAYWVNLGELHQQAGSNALNLGDPGRALEHFEASAVCAADTYDGDAFPRGYAIYVARQAQAQCALGDVEGAVAAAREAVDHMGGIDSARGSSTLTDLRTTLANHRDIGAVRDFLDATR